jgi:hypothetical protein
MSIGGISAAGERGVLIPDQRSVAIALVSNGMYHHKLCRCFHLACTEHHIARQQMSETTTSPL